MRGVGNLSPLIEARTYNYSLITVESSLLFFFVCVLFELSLKILYGNSIQTGESLVRERAIEAGESDRDCYSWEPIAVYRT